MLWTIRGECSSGTVHRVAFASEGPPLVLIRQPAGAKVRAPRPFRDERARSTSLIRSWSVRRLCASVFHLRQQTSAAVGWKRATGLEPVTPCLEGRCSRQLSYARVPLA